MSKREDTEREFAVLFANRCGLAPEEAKEIIAAIREHYGFTICGPDEFPMPYFCTLTMQAAGALVVYDAMRDAYQRERAGSQGEGGWSTSIEEFTCPHCGRQHPLGVTCEIGAP